MYIEGQGIHFIEWKFAVINYDYNYEVYKNEWAGWLLRTVMNNIKYKISTL